MTSLERALGIDTTDPETQRAIALAQEDHDFLRELVAMRARHGLTQANVGDQLGLSQATISAFERHDNDPRMSTVRRYAQVVGAMVSHRVVSDPAFAASGEWTSIRAAVRPTVTAAGAAGQVWVDTSRGDFALAA